VGGVVLIQQYNKMMGGDVYIAGSTHQVTAVVLKNVILDEPDQDNCRLINHLKITTAVNEFIL